MKFTTYRARWIVPVTSPPIENGRLQVIDGRIAQLVRASRLGGESETDFGDAVILPGFVNAHTHLELTPCRGEVPYRGSFVAWIRDLVALTPSASPESVVESVRQGVQESAAAGVTALADIGHGAAACEAWHHAPLSITGFLEVLGMGPRRDGRHERSVADAISLCAAAAPRELQTVGLSPHAPYSTDPGLYQQAIAFCRQAGRPVCTHLAETREEEQFLRDGTGPFRELLESWGLWDGSFTPPGCSPVFFAQRLGLLECSPILAHVNYANDEDLDVLAKSQASVAYCPRTHRFFEHEPHRYRDMLARGVKVCIGTDSLASSQTLSILDELRFLRRIDRHTPDRQLLALGTIAGARALGWDAEIGSLQPGKRADFAAVPLGDPTTRDPIHDLLEGAAAPAAVVLNGEPVPA